MCSDSENTHWIWNGHKQRVRMVQPSWVTMRDFINAELGSIAFMSNLMREMFSFILIPFSPFTLIIILVLLLLERQVKILHCRLC